jgi:hypothetical protein
MAAMLAQAHGEPVKHIAMAPAEYAACRGVEDLANMFQYYHDFSYEFLAQRPIALSRELHPGLMGFALARGERLADPYPRGQVKT